MSITINDQKLKALRSALGVKMSQKRYRHTCEVESMAIRLGELYCPDKIEILRAAALLHDITKEYPYERQLAICEEHGIVNDRIDFYCPKTFHAKTAAALIPTEYAEFALDEVVSAVRWHTTGHENMTLAEKLIYLADYIDMSRSFDDCVMLRRYFWGAEPQNLDAHKREVLLRDTLIMSFDMTIKQLLSEGSPVDKDTISARNYLVAERYEYLNSLKNNYGKENI